MSSQPCEKCGEPAKGELCPECQAEYNEQIYDAAKENGEI